MSTAENHVAHWNFTGSEQRLRRILQLAPFESLPEVDSHALRTYYQRLLQRLELPFSAEAIESTGADRQVTIERLLDPARHPSNLESGLLCEARQQGQLVRIPLAELKVEPDHRNYQLIEDYWYWFWNWRK